MENAQASVEYTTEDYDRVALKNISIPFLSGALYGESPSVCDRAAAKIAERREWAERLTDERWRKAYLGWIEHAERGVSEARAAYADRARERALAASAPRP